MTDEVRDMIAKALDGEPPVAIDYESVRAAGRKRLARRNVGIAGGAALGVLAVVSAAVTVSQLAASPPNLPAAGLSPPSTGGQEPAPPAGCVVPAYQGGYSRVPDGAATPAELAESARLTGAFARLALPLPAGVTVEPAKPQLCVVEGSWGADLTLHGPAGDRSLGIEVLPRAGQPPGECVRLGGQGDCRIVPTADGGAVRITVAKPPGPTWPTIVNVEAWRSDATVVRLLETGSERQSPPPRLLGDDALIAIATAPELRVEWPQGPVRPAEPSDRRAAELTVAVPLAGKLPSGLRAQRAPGAANEALAFYVSQGGYKLNADLVDAQGTGNLFINLDPPSGQSTVECPAGVSCERLRLPDGRMATYTRQSAGGTTTVGLATLAADGTGVTIMTSNRSEQGGKVRPEPPLDKGDLVSIAMEPGLRW